VAVLGTVFFGIARPTAHGMLDAATAVDAATTVTLLTIVLSVAAFAMAFLLPRKARTHADQGETTTPQPELALAA
jgi:hypothetical protein